MTTNPTRPSEGTLFGTDLVVAEKTVLAGVVLSKGHVQIKGLSSDGRVLAVAADPDGKAIPGARLVEIDATTYPRLTGLLARHRRGSKS